MERVTLDIAGMSCGHCVGAVTRALQSVNGVAVERVSVGSATVAFDPAVVSTDDVARAVEEAGYEARPAART
ncbi:MAG TPA: heavy-metal-associated domain-containing protein [Gemmatimonadaceae bacterium]|nr:heavy-metal-associated domain-containing protein [Gemmatimonadaceae bacterium]